ncbi:MAG: hypothetical protein ACD_29C00101G0001, partial [uncultured bacterium]
MTNIISKVSGAIANQIATLRSDDFQARRLLKKRLLLNSNLSKSVSEIALEYSQECLHEMETKLELNKLAKDIQESLHSPNLDSNADVEMQSIQPDVKSTKLPTDLIELRALLTDLEKKKNGENNAQIEALKNKIKSFFRQNEWVKLKNKTPAISAIEFGEQYQELAKNFSTECAKPSNQELMGDLFNPRTPELITAKMIQNVNQAATAIQTEHDAAMEKIKTDKDALVQLYADEINLQGHAQDKISQQLVRIQAIVTTDPVEKNNNAERIKKLKELKNLIDEKANSLIETKEVIEKKYQELSQIKNPWNPEINILKKLLSEEKKDLKRFQDSKPKIAENIFDLAETTHAFMIAIDKVQAALPGDTNSDSEAGKVFAAFYEEIDEMVKLLGKLIEMQPTLTLAYSSEESKQHDLKQYNQLLEEINKQCAAIGRMLDIRETTILLETHAKILGKQDELRELTGYLKQLQKMVRPAISMDQYLHPQNNIPDLGQKDAVTISVDTLRGELNNLSHYERNPTTKLLEKKQVLGKNQKPINLTNEDLIALIAKINMQLQKDNPENYQSIELGEKGIRFQKKIICHTKEAKAKMLKAMVALNDEKLDKKAAAATAARQAQQAVTNVPVT